MGINVAEVFSAKLSGMDANLPVQGNRGGVEAIGGSASVELLFDAAPAQAGTLKAELQAQLDARFGAGVLTVATAQETGVIGADERPEASLHIRGFDGDPALTNELAAFLDEIAVSDRKQEIIKEITNSPEERDQILANSEFDFDPERELAGEELNLTDAQSRKDFDKLLVEKGGISSSAFRAVGGLEAYATALVEKRAANAQKMDDVIARAPEEIAARKLRLDVDGDGRADTAGEVLDQYKEQALANDGIVSDAELAGFKKVVEGIKKDNTRGIEQGFTALEIGEPVIDPLGTENLVAVQKEQALEALKEAGGDKTLTEFNDGSQVGGEVTVPGAGARSDEVGAPTPGLRNP